MRYLKEMIVFLSNTTFLFENFGGVEILLNVEHDTDG